MQSIRNASPDFEVLTEKAIGGDNPSFQQIYDAIAGKMYSLCLRYAGNAHDANDWFQEGFLKLYKSLSGYRGDGSFEGWARRVFVGTCIDGIKKRNQSFSLTIGDTDVSSTSLSGYDKLANEDLMS